MRSMSYKDSVQVKVQATGGFVVPSKERNTVAYKQGVWLLMQTYLFTYAERVSNIVGSYSSTERLYELEQFELTYQPRLNLVLECHVPFHSKLEVEPHPIPKLKNGRLNRLLKCYKYSKSGVYK